MQVFLMSVLFLFGCNPFASEPETVVMQAKSPSGNKPEIPSFEPISISNVRWSNLTARTSGRGTTCVFGMEQGTDVYLFLHNKPCEKIKYAYDKEKKSLRRRANIVAAKKDPDVFALLKLVKSPVSVSKSSNSRSAAWTKYHTYDVFNLSGSKRLGVLTQAEHAAGSTAELQLCAGAFKKNCMLRLSNKPELVVR